MIKYPELKRDHRKFLALTGLTLKEFKALLPAFVEAYECKYPRDRTLAGRKRRRQRGGGCRGVLDTAEQKLLFILTYILLASSPPFQESPVCTLVVGARSARCICKSITAALS